MSKMNPSIIGMRYGVFEVTGFPEKRGKGKVIATCKCGRSVNIRLTDIRTGRSKSCGCDTSGRPVKRHGKTTLPEYQLTYRIWNAMKGRCLNPKSNYWECYGGRGISVCDEWLLNFDNFIRDMGICPPKHSIERDDVNGHYCKENCRWIPLGKQLENTRRTIWITFKGERLCATRACEKAGIKPSTYSVRRIRQKGKSDQEIFDEMLSNYHPKQKAKGSP